MSVTPGARVMPARNASARSGVRSPREASTPACRAASAASSSPTSGRCSAASARKVGRSASSRASGLHGAEGSGDGVEARQGPERGAGSPFEAFGLGAPCLDLGGGRGEPVAVEGACRRVVLGEQLVEAGDGAPELALALANHLRDVEGELKAEVGSANVVAELCAALAKLELCRAHAGRRGVPGRTEAAEGPEWHDAFRHRGVDRPPAVSQRELAVVGEDRRAAGFGRDGQAEVGAPPREEGREPGFQALGFGGANGRGACLERGVVGLGGRDELS